MGPSWMTVLVIGDKIDTFTPKLIFFPLQLSVSFWISRLFKQIKVQFNYYNKKLSILGIYNFNLAYYIYYNNNKDKLHNKPKPLRVFSNKILTNFFFQIKPQPLKYYQKSPSWMIVLVTEDEIIFFLIYGA